MSYRPRRWSPEDSPTTDLGYQPIRRAGVLGGIPTLLAGPLAGPRINERFDPNNPSAGEMPYKKAGFFRQLLGDTANQRNLSFRDQLAQESLQDENERIAFERESQLADKKFEQEQFLNKQRQDASNALAINLAQQQAQLQRDILQGNITLEEFKIRTQQLEREKDRVEASTSAKRAALMPAYLATGTPLSSLDDPISESLAVGEYGRRIGAESAANIGLAEAQARNIGARATKEERTIQPEIDKVTAEANMLRTQAAELEKTSPDRARVLRGQADEMEQRVAESRAMTPYRTNAAGLQNTALQQQIDEARVMMPYRTNAAGLQNTALGQQIDFDYETHPYKINLLSNQMQQGAQANREAAAGEPFRLAALRTQATNAPTQANLQNALLDAQAGNARQVVVPSGAFFAPSSSSPWGIRNQPDARIAGGLSVDAQGKPVMIPDSVQRGKMERTPFAPVSVANRPPKFIETPTPTPTVLNQSFGGSNATAMPTFTAPLPPISPDQNILNATGELFNANRELNAIPDNTMYSWGRKRFIDRINQLAPMLNQYYE